MLLRGGIVAFCPLFLAVLAQAWCFNNMETGPGTGGPTQPDGRRFTIEGRATVPGVSALDWVSTARVLVAGGRHVGFLRTDGGFTVNGVPRGSHVVEVVAPTHRFEPMRVDIASTGETRARAVDRVGTSEEADVLRPYPLRLRSTGPPSYFAKRRGTWGWIAEPSVLAAVLPVLLVFLLTKVVNTGGHPEVRTETERSTKSTLNSNLEETPDGSTSMEAKMLSGSEGRSGKPGSFSGSEGPSGSKDSGKPGSISGSKGSSGKPESVSCGKPGGRRKGRKQAAKRRK